MDVCPHDRLDCDERQREGRSEGLLIEAAERDTDQREEYADEAGGGSQARLRCWPCAGDAPSLRMR